MTIIKQQDFIIPFNTLLNNSILCNKLIYQSLEINILDIHNNIIKTFKYINKKSIDTIKINIILNDFIYSNNMIFIHNNNNKIDNKIIYESNNKLNKIIIDNIEIQNINYVSIDQKYKNNCIKKYKKRNYLKKRIFSINNEINKIKLIENDIKTNIIHKLNFNKNTKESHIKNCEKKLCGTNTYKKPLFLYDLHKLSIKTTKKIINYINNKLQIIIDINNINIEKLYIYFIICKILKNIEMYINYLNSCIKNITSTNIFCLNKKYFGYNDILENKIITDYDKIYKVKYIIKDNNTYAINNYDKNISVGYVLAYDNNIDKWNLFPERNLNNKYKLSDEQIDIFIGFIKNVENEGISLLERFI